MYRAKAFGKINLLLDVTGREENGYHTVNNIMQTVSIYDTVTCVCDKEGITVEYDDGYPVKDTDICLRAAREYEAAAGKKINAEIRINKVIPTAAGLGGNSSAAAAVLLLLDRAYGLVCRERLMEIAAGLGADVPFFLVGGTAVCSHYGEIITPAPKCPEMYLVIAKKGNKSATAEMYRKIDAAEISQKGDLQGMLSALKSGNADDMTNKMYNIFEAFWQTEEIGEIKDLMRSAGARKAMLSGSGPAVFGIFEGEQAAADCCNTLCQRGISCFLCQTTDSGIIIE